MNRPYRYAAMTKLKRNLQMDFFYSTSRIISISTGI